MQERLIEDFLEKHPQYGKNTCSSIVRDLLDFICPHGVVIGGIYEHFKGKRYKVKNIVRDADVWEWWLVQYVEITDATHEASRPLEEFLGLHETGVRRFTLVS